MDLNELPFASWLEDAVRGLIENKATVIAIAAGVQNDQVLTMYYNCGMAEKALLATHINGDAMMDMVLANAGLILDAAEDEEEEEE